MGTNSIIKVTDIADNHAKPIPLNCISYLKPNNSISNTGDCSEIEGSNDEEKKTINLNVSGVVHGDINHINVLNVQIAIMINVKIIIAIVMILFHVIHVYL